MARLKLTKTVVDAAAPKEREYELRDTMVPGFLLKVTPAGRKIFMLQYQTNAGVRRKPAIGRFGELTVEIARKIAQDWLAEVRQGKDPGREKSAARAALTVKQLCERFISDHSKLHNKPSTVETNELNIKNHILPRIGRMKVPDVTRADISALMTAMADRPIIANRTLACLRKMFNLAEVWGLRPDASNPCRHVQKYPEKGSTRFITDDEMRKLYAYLNRADQDGLEHPFITLAIRLQFEFAARMSEVLSLEWKWIDLEQRRVTWPDSKTGGMTKPLSDEAHRLLKTAPRLEDSPFVCPSIFDPSKRMTDNTYHHGWRRILERAGVPHVGTHGIRHRAATDIANSGIPLKVGMALTAHKTVAMFMRYIHNEDDPVRAAANLVAVRRRNVVDHEILDSHDTRGAATAPEECATAEPPAVVHKVVAPPPAGLDDGKYTSRTKVGNYRPFRHRKGPNREVPPRQQPNRGSGSAEGW
ncbi:MAG: tyrosine-type recombinase/integrase [Devosia sp.]|uniref:tyrosine-type recombinase/integrase n=1 Tax=Devosia sp. 66-22 TaxID=1895753 RepID=UPI00092CC78C|nr:site-specific integrase [Devosia sp. 66-22]MBN9344988.1 tyrosine-type recombinase/integrase [Devosia sp.]OJX48721.1 MAG: integrase [Devosia sp. 66-22]